MLDILENTEGLLPAEEIFLKLKDELPNVSLSTVYRSLEQLCNNDIVSAVNIEQKKEVHYELAHTHHAHHLICLSCGKVIHLHDCPVHGYADKMGEKHGFNITEHKLDLYGYCPACQ